MFAGLLRDFKAQVDLEPLFVADSALYGAEQLPSLSRLRWLCRVPATLGEARRLLAETPQEAFTESSLEGYHLSNRGRGQKRLRGRVRQRWLVVENEARREAERAQLERGLRRLDREAEKELRRLGRQRFSCEADARKAAGAFSGRLKYHELAELEVISEAKYEKPGRPAKGSEPRRLYRIEGKLQRDEAAIYRARRRAGRYILATNLLDRQEISGDELLSEYKDQHSVERGFRFLKETLFFTSSVFLKSPKGVAAIAMVMGLCLLVYALGERMLRRALAAEGACVRHQTGKPTTRPTLRWVFQLFGAVHLLRIEGIKQIANLTEERRRILSFLGPSCQRYYLLA